MLLELSATGVNELSKLGKSPNRVALSGVEWSGVEWSGREGKGRKGKERMAGLMREDLKLLELCSRLLIAQ